VSRAIHTTFAALAYANPPEGRTCWTTQLLANELIVRWPDGKVTRQIKVGADQIVTVKPPG